MTRNPRYVVQWGCVRGKLVCIIEESRKVTHNVKGLIRICVCKRVGGCGGWGWFQEVKLFGWMNSVMKGWRIKPDSGLAPGVCTVAPPPSPWRLLL